MADLHIADSRGTLARIEAALKDAIGFDRLYWAERQLDTLQDLFDTLHPFKVGEIIEFVDPPRVDGPDHGWSGAAHHFAVGQLCEVVERGWSTDAKCWTVSIWFVGETWRSPIDGQLRPVESRAMYPGIRASRFRRVDG